jgi:hypothetical protein
LENQIKGACYTYRSWFDKFRKGEQIKLVNGTIIEAENGCTSALLHYTPHISAGETTKKLFNQYFGAEYDAI